MQTQTLKSLLNLVQACISLWVCACFECQIDGTWHQCTQHTERHCTACDLLESAHVSLICWKVSDNCWLRWLTTGYQNPSPGFFRSWIHPWINVHARNELEKSPSEVPLDKQLCWSSKALHCKVPARGNTAMPERFEQANDQLLTPTKLLGRVPVLVGEWSRPWSDSLAIKNYPNNFTTLGQTTNSKDRICLDSTKIPPNCLALPGRRRHLWLEAHVQML